jgi:hypothetical protein
MHKVRDGISIILLVLLIGNFAIQIALRSLLSPGKQDKIDELIKCSIGSSNNSIGVYPSSRQELWRCYWKIWVRFYICVPKRITDMCVLECTKDDKWLDELKPQGFVRGRPTAECMDGTREDIMAEIDEWCDNLDASSNILWISGFPGVGKSAIARKLATRLKSLHRFGSSFFFQRELAAVHTPVNLWRTIAFDLSREYPSASAIVTKVSTNRRIYPVDQSCSCAYQ